MLKQRVITAVVLLLVIVLALLSPRPEPLVAILTLVAACATWEWLRLISPNAHRLALAGAVIVFFALGALAIQWFSAAPAAWSVGVRTLFSTVLLPLVVLGWIAGATYAVVRANTKFHKQHWRMVAVFTAVPAVWMALVLLFQQYG